MLEHWDKMSEYVGGNEEEYRLNVWGGFDEIYAQHWTAEGNV